MDVPSPLETLSKTQVYTFPSASLPVSYDGVVPRFEYIP